MEAEGRLMDELNATKSSDSPPPTRHVSRPQSPTRLHPRATSRAPNYPPASAHAAIEMAINLLESADTLYTYRVFFIMIYVLSNGTKPGFCISAAPGK